MTNPSILIVDDDRELDQMLAEYLQAESFGTEIETDGRQALARLENETFDLVILDVMLPSLNGFDVLRKLRHVLTVPVIMLTARGEDADCIRGLELGADDYLAKPFNPRQLVARIRAVLRRTAALGDEPGQPITVGPLALDPASHVARADGKALTVTDAEFRLLEMLMQTAGTVNSRELLTERVLGRALSAYDRSIDTHVSNLRRKLASSGAESIEVRSVRGAGYVLTCREEASA
jgi:DNA-binding response OmpR family regulator